MSERAIRTQATRTRSFENTFTDLRLLDRDHFKQSVRCKMTNHKWQLLMYLDRITTACARGNTRLRIFCHASPANAAPMRKPQLRKGTATNLV
jgi:hypothetical protein